MWSTHNVQFYAGTDRQILLEHSYCRSNSDTSSPPRKILRLEKNDTHSQVSDIEVHSPNPVGDEIVALVPDVVANPVCEEVVLATVTDKDFHQEEISEKSQLFLELMEMFNKNMQKSSNSKNQEYGKNIKKFALTMFCYSPKAYR